MPTIPMGNFGQSVAQPQRAARVVADTGLSDAIGQVAKTVQGISLDQIAAQTRLDQQAREVEAQTNAGRVRVKTINDAADLSDQINRGILDGTIDKDKAAEEWSARFKELTNGRLDGMDPRYAGPLQVAFEDLQARGLNGVRDTLTKRDQQDTQANLLTLGEEYQRMAAKDRPRAVAEYTAQVDAMGPRAGWTPEQIALKKQQFREGTAYTLATGLVGSARDLTGVRKAREALASDSFADLDPQRRAQIEATLDGRETTYLQRQEIAAQRAQRQAEARLSRAEAAFKAGQSLIDTGIPLAPEEYDRLAAATSGTPFAGALQQLQARAREVGGFAAQPIKVQQAALDQVNAQIAQQGASEALVKRRDSLQRVLEGSKNDIKEDPLRAGLQRGVITELPAIDTRSVEGFSRSVAARLQQAQVVQAWSGQPVSPLTSEEAQQLWQTLASLQISQQASAMAEISAQLGDSHAQALAAQIDKNNRPLALALAVSSRKTSGTTTWYGAADKSPRFVSEIILKGASAISDKRVGRDEDSPDRWKAEIADAVGDAYLSPQQAQAVKDAAYYILAGLKSEEGGDVKQAVNLAAGGDIVDFNRKKVRLPAGMSQGDLEYRLRSLKPQDFASQTPGGVVRMRGQETTVDAFVQALPDAQLISVGRGRYAVQVGGRMVTNAQGHHITVTAKP